MPAIYPFRPYQYNRGQGDLSRFIAPPYDVLDAAGKAALLAKSPDNIVGIDLPHTPAKQLGPKEAYASAAAALSSLISRGTLSRPDAPAIFAYRQTTTTNGVTQARKGMAVCVDAVPFGARKGGGILPHEETFSGPKEDRMALMKATRTQLSPIFGLHADEKGLATKLIDQVVASRQPDATADMGDGVKHEIWTITDPSTIASYQAALAGEDIFIADGHHRYSTGLNYIKELDSLPNPPSTDHPARRSMMVLIGMSDPGLVIWPTHRVLGGMAGYTFDSFLAAASSDIRIEPFKGSPQELEVALEKRTDLGELRFALIDCATGTSALAAPKEADPLAHRFPTKPVAWRQLSVAYIQYILVEKIAQGTLNNNQPITWAFPHTIPEVIEIAKGKETGAGGGKGFAQLAIIVRPTPLTAVRDVSRAGELMPQKSTFFYPKIATGLFISPLE